MKKSQLLKFLEPFDDDIDVVIEINDGIDPQEVDFEPNYRLDEQGNGKVYLFVDNEI